jgi:branched-chain amino acid transport system ATP-binding protein
MTMLRLEKVSKHFGGIRAVSDVDAGIEEGRVTAIIGPNGAGKTTLFNTISGIYPPTSGAIAFGTRDITGMAPHRVATLGVARTFQHIRLFATLTVLDNVRIGFHARTRAGFIGAVLPFIAREEERDITLSGVQCLDFVGLGTEAGKVAGSLPYGKQRLVEIARALASQPKLILLDEPAAGMNPTESEALMALVRKICAAGVTVLLIEHDMRVVMGVSDYVYVLDHGEKIAEGTPDAVCRNEKVIEAYLGCEDHGPTA